MGRSEQNESSGSFLGTTTRRLKLHMIVILVMHSEPALDLVQQMRLQGDVSERFREVHYADA